ncbi:MAG: taurine dioxygenase [Bacteroidota bacterium]|jgi:hypothetical protein
MAEILFTKNTKKLINDKIIGFKKLNITKDEYKNLVLDICPSDVSGNKDFYLVGKNSHKYLYQPNIDTLSKHEIDNFKRWCMHVDVTPIVNSSNNILEENTHTSYVSMHMTNFTCDSSFGKTLFLNLIKLYNDCPQKYIELLMDNKLEHHIATGKEHDIDAPIKTEINMDQYELDYRTTQSELEIEEAKIKNLPSIFFPFRTHPITRETILFWPTYSSVQLHGGSRPWFEEFKMWVKEYLDNQENWYEWEWSQGDVIIFDNRCMLHTFTPGWKPEQRVFDQIIVGFEKPFYNHKK